jgi:hypothetical protein
MGKYNQILVTYVKLGGRTPRDCGLENALTEKNFDTMQERVDLYPGWNDEFVIRKGGRRINEGSFLRTGPGS